MKYLMVKPRHGQISIGPYPVLFTAPITHKEMADILVPAGYEITSAGYYDPVEGVAFGRSSSLNIEASDRDSTTIRILAGATLKTAPARLDRVSSITPDPYRDVPAAPANAPRTWDAL